MKTSAYLLLALAAIISTGCKVFQVADGKTAQNTPSIGLDFQCVECIENETLRRGMDSTINAFMDNWNREKHVFTVHSKLPREKDYISFDLYRAKMVRTPGKVIGYTLFTAGLALIPYSVYVTGGTLASGLLYLPSHEVIYRGELSPELSAERRGKGFVGGEAGALFQGDRSARTKIYRRFDKTLRERMGTIEKQLMANK